ncbi:hypothetical protein ACVW16_000263 [Bradyrhizobium sp. USDA 4474]
MKLWKRCRSEQQMAQLVTLMIAFLASSISGSVTVSHLISSLPCQTSAFLPTTPIHAPPKRELVDG